MGHYANDCPQNDRKRRKSGKSKGRTVQFIGAGDDALDGEDEYENLRGFDSTQNSTNTNNPNAVSQSCLRSKSKPHSFITPSSRRRYILPLGTINTTNTDRELNEQVRVPLTIIGRSSEAADGRYSGFIDTGSNTPAMN